MARGFFCHSIIILALCLSSIHYSKQLQSSQVLTLSRILQLLRHSSILKNSTDLCNAEPTSYLTVFCYEETITQLHITGKRVHPLPRNFSMDSFVTTLVKLPSLKVLTLVSVGLWGPLPGKIGRLSSLEILNISLNFLHGSIPHELTALTNLHTLILDQNLFNGELPEWLEMFPSLTVLSLKNNSMNGPLPDSLRSMRNLRVLALSDNDIVGEVPDLSTLTNLETLDLEGNAFGPQFPQLGNKLVVLVLGKNRFRSGIPDQLISCVQLQRLDLSFNKFVGPFPLSVLSLPSITYLNIAGNKLTGMLSDDLSCGAELAFVNLSSNLLTGKLSKCIQSNSKGRVVLYARNCLSTTDQNQLPLPFCRNEAIAAGTISNHKARQSSKEVLALGLIGGIIGGTVLFGVVILLIRGFDCKKTTKASSPSTTTSIAESTSMKYSSKLLYDARYLSEAMKVGALALPPYRTFSLDDLEEATNNFSTSAFMGEGSHGQVYKGQLRDGSLVAIRCLRMKKSHGNQNIMHQLEMISKFRHRHLVSALGHCLDCYLDYSSASIIFLVFEYVPNRSLRSWISEGNGKQKLTWAQRIAAAIGIAKGIQFLHSGIVPGVLSNSLRATDILLDHSLAAKISICNLPLLARIIEGAVPSGKYKENTAKARIKDQDKEDVYDFGVILLETIVGKPFKSKHEVEVVREQLQTSILAENEAMKSIIDPTIQKACSDESLRTTLQICVRCVLKNPSERPSIEDVLWNLQFSAQVQDAYQTDSRSGDGSLSLPDQPSWPQHGNH